MICPVCNSEIQNASICPECGFYQCKDAALSSNDFQQWKSTLVASYRQEYWKRFPDFVIDGTKLLKYTGSNNTVSIPKGITEITRDAFSSTHCDTSKIRKIILPEGIEIIESSAFSSCYKLVEINIPKTVQSLGSWIFPVRQRCLIICETEQNPFEKDNEWVCYFPIDRASMWDMYAYKNNPIVAWKDRWFYYDGKQIPEEYCPVLKEEFCVDYPEVMVELTLLSAYWPADGDIEFEFIAENLTDEELSLRAFIIANSPLLASLYLTGDYEDYMYLKPKSTSYHTIVMPRENVNTTLYTEELSGSCSVTLDIFLNTEDEDDADEHFIDLESIREAWEDQ